MRLILTKITNIEKTWHGFHELFNAWLWYNNIFIGEYRRDWELSYNDFYHFYDLSLFEIKGNYGDARCYHFKQVEDFFNREGYCVENLGYTWRWEDTDKGKKRIDGVRIWIYPKDFYDTDVSDVLHAANEMLGDMRVKRK